MFKTIEIFLQRKKSPEKQIIENELTELKVTVRIKIEGREMRRQQNDACHYIL